jgi:hypothetical protein
MNFDELLNGLKCRVSWPTLNAILLGLEIPIIGRGKNEVIKNLAPYLNEKENIDKANLLLIYFYAQILVGEKAVKIFKVETDIVKSLINSFESIEPQKSIFKDKYPFPVSQKELKDVNSSQNLVEIKTIEKGLQLVFCSKRDYTERLGLDLNIIREEERKNLADLSEIIGIKKYARQAYDIVTLRERGMIEVRIDNPLKMSSDDRYRAFLKTSDSLNYQIKNISKFDSVLNEPINFFSAIKNLYNSSEGRVCELWFETDGASIKREKMRKRHIDLRSEAYHKAGKDAVDHITPCRLGIRWNFIDSNSVETEPELLLPGNTRDLGSSNQRLEEAIIERCSSLEDYDFVFDKLISYLN